MLSFVTIEYILVKLTLVLAFGCILQNDIYFLYTFYSNYLFSFVFIYIQDTNMRIEK